MIGAAAPSPLWFATRGAGTATLVLLTLVVGLGVLTAGGARAVVWPRFLSAGLHRNLSLFTVAFLAVHIVTAVADPYAKLGWRDATIPFASAYRPFWLGLGVVASELVAALVVSSLIRPLLGHSAWRSIHWLAYASWPVAVLHSLGTGTDAPAVWGVGLAAACTLVVVTAGTWRLAAGTPATARLRTALGIAIFLGVAASSAWAADGPLRAGWARRAGTPPAMIAGGSGAGTAKVPASPAASATPGAIQDLVTGSVVHLPSGQTRWLLTDLRDPSMQFVVRSAGPGDPGPLLAVVHNGQTGCIAPVAIGASMSATCGKTRLWIVITQQDSGGNVAGRVLIQPA